MIDTLKGGPEQYRDEGGRITRGRDWVSKLHTTEHMGAPVSMGRDREDFFLKPKEERGTAKACMQI